MILLVVVGVVSAALVLGALWGLFWPFPKQVEGFVIALAGGALIVAVILELLEPAVKDTNAGLALGFLFVGALVFTVVDYLVDEKWGGQSGGGLLAAITLDGVPENLALGVALIGTGPLGVLSLASSIFLSNLPEAAGGARQMRDKNFAKGKVILLWAATAGLLSVAALIGNVAMRGAPVEVLAAIRSFAGGAVIASLATEVFPTAYQDDHHLAGIATAIGLVLAYLLHTLA